MLWFQLALEVNCEKIGSSDSQFNCNRISVKAMYPLNVMRRLGIRCHDVIYCARGQAENLIKMHKSQLASDRTSCRSPIANQSVLSCTPPHTG